MGPDSLLGLAVLIVAVLPGSMYTWAFERQAGAYGVSLADRALRFIGMSLGLHLVFGWLEYLAFRSAFVDAHRFQAGQFAWAWTGVFFLTAVPLTVGSAVGGLYATRGSRDGWQRIRQHLTAQAETRLVRFMLGRDPAPRAWDDLFSERPNCWIRVKLANGSWVGGAFASESYAAGFPNETDLLIEEAWRLDEDSREFIEALGYQLYIPAGQLQWMELLPAISEGDA